MTVNFSASSSSLKKGESFKDTAQNIEAMKIDAVVIRHPSPVLPIIYLNLLNLLSLMLEMVRMNTHLLILDMMV